MKIKIKKANGEIQDFIPAKLLNSLIRAGAEPEHAHTIVKDVTSQIQPHMSTRKIYRMAHKYLRHYNKASVLRYSIKQALLRLGPSGYPFEKYVGEILSHLGYSVQVGIKIDGKCVNHEVDVFAENDKEIILVECKYRNHTEGSHDVKTALYVHSRHQDLRAAMENTYPDKEIKGWLVINTRFTTDALQFGECSGMTLKSWRYPEKESLEKMIENLKLYPITVMSNLNSKQVKTLIDNNIILMKDLARMDYAEISKILSISEKRASTIKKQAEELCAC
jgi:Holliday junction resolvase-like predicted endonuclease